MSSQNQVNFRSVHGFYVLMGNTLLVFRVLRMLVTCHVRLHILVNKPLYAWLKCDCLVMCMERVSKWWDTTHKTFAASLHASIPISIVSKGRRTCAKPLRKSAASSL